MSRDWTFSLEREISYAGVKVYLVSGEQCEVRLGDRLQLGDDNPGQALAIFCLVEARDK